MSHKTVENLLIDRIASNIAGYPGLIIPTREALQLYPALSNEDVSALDGFAQQLAAHLSADRQPVCAVEWSDYASRFRSKMPDQSLLHIACMYVAVSSPIWQNGRLQSPIQALRNTSRSFNEQRKDSAFQWLAWVVRLREMAALLSREQQCQLFGSELPADDLASLSHIVRSLPEPKGPSSDQHIIRRLSLTDAQELARQTAGLLDANSAAGVDIAADLLSDLACLVPGAIEGLHARLAAHPSFFSQQLGMVFWQAPAPTASTLLQHKDNPNGMLRSLVWTADPSVPAILRWLTETRELQGLHVPPSEYAFEAGWELAAGDQRRQLYFDTSYELVKPAKAAPGEGESPVAVVTDSPLSCGRCGNPMANLLDMQVSDPRLSFLGLSGRLVVPTCSHCFDWTFARTDDSGQATWLPESTGHGEGSEGFVPLPRRKLTLGPAARTPLHSMVTWGSCLGGHPLWLQDAVYPECPGCGRRMMFIGQVSLDLLGGDGMAYAFLCHDCRITATHYSCT